MKDRRPKTGKNLSPVPGLRSKHLKAYFLINSIIISQAPGEINFIIIDIIFIIKNKLTKLGPLWYSKVCEKKDKKARAMFNKTFERLNVNYRRSSVKDDY